MAFSTFLPLAAFAVAITITPGPNTLMLMSSGLNFGVRRSMPLLAGVISGFAILLLFAGVTVQATVESYPQILWLLKAGGTTYLLWLASRLWRAAAESEDASTTPISFVQAAAFQFINPKAWLIAITVTTALAEQASGFFGQTAASLLFMSISFPFLLSWILFGAAIRKLLNNPHMLCLFNRAVAMLTGLCAAVFWF